MIIVTWFSSTNRQKSPTVEFSGFCVTINFDGVAKASTDTALMYVDASSEDGYGDKQILDDDSANTELTRLLIAG